jgi:hypothetical protein
MAGTLTISTLSDGTNSTSSTNCIQGSAKAWVRFNGTVASPTIASSYNVSSVTKSGTGAYTVNFTNAFADTNYCCAGMGVDAAGPVITMGTPSTTSCAIGAVIPNVSLSDCPRAGVIFLR